MRRVSHELSSQVLGLLLVGHVAQIDHDAPAVRQRRCGRPDADPLFGPHRDDVLDGLPFGRDAADQCKDLGGRSRCVAQHQPGRLVAQRGPEHLVEHHEPAIETVENVLEERRSILRVLARSLGRARRSPPGHGGRTLTAAHRPDERGADNESHEEEEEVIHCCSSV